MSMFPKKKRLSSEIDITPMIDIVFLLLIFFMVCSTMENQNTVALPPAQFGSAVSMRNATIITLAGEGPDMVVYIGDGTDGEPLPNDRALQEDMVANAVEAAVREGRTAVLIKASKRLHWGPISRIEAAATRIEGVTLHKAVHEER